MNKKEQGYQGSQKRFFNRERRHESCEIGSGVYVKHTYIKRDYWSTNRLF
jgi:hypothetical protein